MLFFDKKRNKTNKTEIKCHFPIKVKLLIFRKVSFENAI